MNTNEYITASELGEYVFCKRAWWLRQQGKLPEATSAMIEGREKHTKLFGTVKGLRIRTILAWLYILCGAIIMLAIIFFS